MKKRAVSIDLIKTIAIFFVMITHMLNYRGAFQGSLSIIWDIQCFVKYIAITGVLLFILITGYLQSRKGFTLKYYISIIPVLVSYFIITIGESAVERIFFHKDVFNLAHVVGIFDYTYGYGWYVEMYIGLFLIIPFLNKLFSSLTSSGQLCLILILCIMTCLPTMFEGITVSGVALRIFPDFFKNLYVITIYYVGAYIREHQPVVSKLKCALVMLLVLVAETVYCHICSQTEYAWWVFNNVGALSHCIVAVCIFLMLYRLNITNRLISAVTYSFSSCSLEIYLISYITDMLCYNHLRLNIVLVFIINVFTAFVSAKVVKLASTLISKILQNGILKIADR